MHKILCFCIMFLSLLGQGCGGTIPDVHVGPAFGPRAADSMAAQMDAQIMERAFATTAAHMPRDVLAMQQRKLRNSITIVTTVPVNLNDLSLTNALSRQISEEMSRWFISAGYRVQEIRKGKDLYFQEKAGEMLLTRHKPDLAKTTVTSIAVLTGTYVISPDQVRYTTRLLHSGSNEVIAMGAATVPITADVPPLLRESVSQRVTPSVNTRLQ